MKSNKFVKINPSNDVPLNFHFLRITKNELEETVFIEYVDEYSSMARVHYFYKRNSNIVIYGSNESR